MASIPTLEPTAALKLDRRQAFRVRRRDGAAVDDATAAFAHIVEHADQFGATADLIAVGGDSAGANLAAAVAHGAVRTGNTSPLLSLLLYPTTDVSGEHASHLLFGEGFLLDQETLLWYRDQIPAG